MDLEPDAVAERELKALARILPGPRSLGAMPGGLEDVADQGMQLAPRYARPHRHARSLERLAHQRLQGTDDFVDITHDVGPGHVRPARRRLIARPQVDDDRQ